MSEWQVVACREFWDVPRSIVARRGDDLYFFDSRFDDALDDYLGYYEVWRLPPLDVSCLSGTWAGLERRAVERLPNVGLRELPFELSSRSAPDSGASGPK